MLRPFPTTIERKRELHAAILREGGGPLMEDIAKWRALFPGSRMVYVTVGNLEVGERPGQNAEVFHDDHEAMKLVASNRRKTEPTPEEVVAKVAAKKRNTASKRTRK